MKTHHFVSLFFFAAALGVFTLSGATAQTVDSTTVTATAAPATPTPTTTTDVVACPRLQGAVPEKGRSMTDLPRRTRTLQATGLASGTAVCPRTGLAKGYGDGTRPRPRDGTGFGARAHRDGTVGAATSGQCRRLGGQGMGRGRGWGCRNAGTTP